MHNHQDKNIIWNAKRRRKHKDNDIKWLLISVNMDDDQQYISPCKSLSGK